jgi:hypothetical protein
VTPLPEPFFIEFTGTNDFAKESPIIQVGLKLSNDHSFNHFEPLAPYYLKPIQTSIDTSHPEKRLFTTLNQLWFAREQPGSYSPISASDSGFW